MTELSLHDDQRHPLARHFHRVRMAQLMRREAPPDPRLQRDLVRLQPGCRG
jgi:hypothetical protein